MFSSISASVRGGERAVEGRTWTATVYYNGDEIDYFEVLGDTHEEAYGRALEQLQEMATVTVNANG